MEKLTPIYHVALPELITEINRHFREMPSSGDVEIFENLQVVSSSPVLISLLLIMEDSSYSALSSTYLGQLK